MTDGNSALRPTPTRVETQSFGQNEQQQVQIGGPQPPIPNYFRLVETAHSPAKADKDLTVRESRETASLRPVLNPPGQCFRREHRHSPYGLLPAARPR